MTELPDAVALAVLLMLALGLWGPGRCRRLASWLADLTAQHMGRARQYAARGAAALGLIAVILIVTANLSAGTSSADIRQYLPQSFLAANPELANATWRLLDVPVAQAAPVQRAVDFIGCSNTEDYWEGFLTVEPTQQRANRSKNAFSGLVAVWSTPTSGYWTGTPPPPGNVGLAGFANARATAAVAYPQTPTYIWWELCQSGNQATPTGGQLDAIVTAAATYSLNQRHVIFVSSLSQYETNPTPVATCSETNFGGDNNFSVKQTVKTQQTVLARGYPDVYPGPVVPTLNATTTSADGCHPNTTGEQVVGKVLATFFDGLPPALQAVPPGVPVSIQSNNEYGP